MNRRQIANTIYKEINRINKEIDVRIVTGKSYALLAKKHKYLMNQLNKVCTTSGLFTRPSLLFFL